MGMLYRILAYCMTSRVAVSWFFSRTEMAMVSKVRMRRIDIDTP